jgi:hypothetical protein
MAGGFEGVCVDGGAGSPVIHACVCLCGGVEVGDEGARGCCHCVELALCIAQRGNVD